MDSMPECCGATDRKRRRFASAGTIVLLEWEKCESLGGLLAEHPLVSPYMRQIDGGLDAIMGLSKTTVTTLLVQMWESTDSFASP